MEHGRRANPWPELCTPARSLGTGVLVRQLQQEMKMSRNSIIKLTIGLGLAGLVGCAVEERQPSSSDLDDALRVALAEQPVSQEAPVVPVTLCDPQACAGQPVSQIACADGTPPERACISVASTPCQLTVLGCEEPVSCGAFVGEVCPAGQQCVTHPDRPNEPGICIETPPLPAPRVWCGPRLSCDADSEICEIFPTPDAARAYAFECTPRATGSQGCDLENSEVCLDDDDIVGCREHRNGGTYVLCE